MTESIHGADRTERPRDDRRRAERPESRRAGDRTEFLDGLRSSRASAPARPEMDREGAGNGSTCDRRSASDRPPTSSRSDPAATGRPPGGSADVEAGARPRGSTADGAAATRVLDPRIVALAQRSVSILAPASRLPRLLTVAPHDADVERPRRSSFEDPGPAAVGSAASSSSPGSGENAFASVADAALKGVNTDAIAQMVEFVRLRMSSGRADSLQLSLGPEVLGGARIELTALGRRRVGLRIRPGAGRPLRDEDVGGLVAALESRGLSVAACVLMDDECRERLEP